MPLDPISVAYQLARITCLCWVLVGCCIPWKGCQLARFESIESNGRMKKQDSLGEREAQVCCFLYTAKVTPNHIRPSSNGMQVKSVDDYDNRECLTTMLSSPPLDSCPTPFQKFLRTISALTVVHLWSHCLARPNAGDCSLHSQR